MSASTPIEVENSAVVHNRDAIAEPLGFFHVVRRVNQRATVGLQLFDALEDVVARLRIHAHGRLVEKDYLWIMHQGGGHIEPPLHAAGICLRAGAAPVLKSGELQRPGDTLFQAAPVRLYSRAKNVRFSRALSSS